MIWAGCPLGLEYSHVPIFWLLLYLDPEHVCGVSPWLLPLGDLPLRKDTSDHALAVVDCEGIEMHCRLTLPTSS